MLWARRTLTFIAGVALVSCAYWNLLALYSSTQKFRPREADKVVIREQHMARIRKTLSSAGYSGEIAFVTNGALRGLPPTPEENERWGQSQYAMLPWVLVRNKRDTAFAIADFWDGLPTAPMTGWSPVFDAGNGLILFRRNDSPQ